MSIFNRKIRDELIRKLCLCCLFFVLVFLFHILLHPFASSAPFPFDSIDWSRIVWYEVRGMLETVAVRGKKGKTWGWKKKHTRFNVLFFNVLDPLILKGFKVGMSLWAMYGSQYLRFAFNSQCKIFEAYISIINYGDGEEQHCHGWIEWILFRRSCVRCKSSPEQIFDDHSFVFPQDRTVHFS